LIIIYQDKIDEIEAIIEVDEIVRDYRRGIAKSWGWILANGVLNVVGGLLALLLPILATEVALNAIGFSLSLLGIFNVVGVTGGLTGDFDLSTFLVGCAQLYLAYRITFAPFVSLQVLTYLILIKTVSSGIYDTIWSLRKRRWYPRWVFGLVNGVSSIAVGLYALAKMPISTLFVPGLALGISLTTNGLAKINLGIVGQTEANEMIDMLG